MVTDACQGARCVMMLPPSWLPEDTRLLEVVSKVMELSGVHETLVVAVVIHEGVKTHTFTGKVAAHMAHWSGDLTPHVAQCRTHMWARLVTTVSSAPLPFPQHPLSSIQLDFWQRWGQESPVAGVQRAGQRFSTMDSDVGTGLEEPGTPAQEVGMLALWWQRSSPCSPPQGTQRRFASGVLSFVSQTLEYSQHTTHTRGLSFSLLLPSQGCPRSHPLLEKLLVSLAGLLPVTLDQYLPPPLASWCQRGGG